MISLSLTYTISIKDPGRYNMVYKRKFPVLKTWLEGKNILLLSMQFIGVVLAFLSNLIMTRLFGEEAYGVYSLFTSWASFLAVIGLFGMDDSHLTRVPILRIRQETDKIIAHLLWSFKVNSITILISLLLFAALVYLIKLPGLGSQSYYLKFALAIVVLTVAVNNLFFFLRSLNKIVWGELLEKAGRPVLFMLFLIICYYSRMSDPAAALLWASVLSIGIVFILQIILVRHSLQKGNNRSLQKERFSIRPNFRYVLLNMLYMLAVRIDILVLGILSTAVQVGYYNIALKFSDMVSYPLAIANLSLPVIYAHYKHKNHDIENPSILYGIAQTAFFQSLAIGAVLSIAGSAVLGWYGEGFPAAFPALCVLMISNLVSAFGASIDVFYILSRKEKKVIACRLISLCCLIPAAFILIPRLGILGASLATLSGNLIYFACLQYAFYKDYQILIHPFRKFVSGPSAD